MSLSSDHRRFLADAAIDPGVAIAAGVRSIERPEDLPAAFASWRHHRGVTPGIVFPHLGVGGRQVDQYRPDRPVVTEGDDQPRKYLFAAGCSPVVAVHPDMRDRIAGGGPLLVVEGTKQYLAAVSTAPTDVMVVGVAGCQGWRSDGVPLDDWNHLGIEGRDVVVAFDADVASNRAVHDAGRLLGEHLELLGAASVRFLRAPAGSKAGLDDYLASVAADRRLHVLATLIERAGPLPKPPAKRATKATGTMPRGDAFPAAVDDASMAAAFAASIVGRFLYVGARRRWLRWDGRRWADDATEAVYERCRQWVIKLGGQALQSGADSAVIRRIAGFRSRARIEGVVTLARRIEGIAAEVGDFDQHPDMLCVRNGVVDLRDGTLGAHDPGLRITKLADVEYEPGARHPDVDAVLGAVSDDVRPYLQRVVGYAATGHTSEDVVPFFDGSGANGKTTLLEAVDGALGDYAAAVPAALVMSTGRDEHPTLYANLAGRRLVHVSETEEGGALRVERLKALSGGDPIAARFIGADYFTFQPSHMLVVATNHRPKVNNHEHAVWRRLRLVPFPYSYRAEPRGAGERPVDRHLRRRLRGAAQRSAMLAWIVAGAIEWHRGGLGSSAEVDAATAAWRSEEDVIARFIDDCLDLDATAETRGVELYRAYADWCAGEGRRPKSNKNFAADFESHPQTIAAGVERARAASGVLWRGVQIGCDPWRDVGSAGTPGRTRDSYEHLNRPDHPALPTQAPETQGFQASAPSALNAEPSPPVADPDELVEVIL